MYVINLNIRMCCHNRKDVPRSIINILTLQMHKTEVIQILSCDDGNQLAIT